MGAPRTAAVIQPANRMAKVTYAIRRVVEEARKVEAAGKRVWYLNTGDPVAFGFEPPPHMVDAVQRALREGEHGYGPSTGLVSAREAIAEEYTSRGWPVPADHVIITAGSSEAIDFTLSALADPGDEILIPLPTYPLYTAVIARLGAREIYYRADPENGWLPDAREIRRLITPRTRVIVVNDPNNPTGMCYPTPLRRELLNLTEEYGLTLVADEIYLDLAYDGPVAPIGSLEPDAPIISLSGLSKGYLAPGWRTGWVAVGNGSRLRDVMAAITRLAEGRLCTTMPMQHAIAPALTGDRTHQQKFRDALRERAELVHRCANAIPGMSCALPKAAFYAMPRVDLPPGKTDIEYVVELLHATGVLCVYGSGFGMPATDGYFRAVFLAPPSDLSEIFDKVADFTRSFLVR